MNEVVGVAGMPALGTYFYAGVPYTATERESQTGVQVQENCTAVSGSVTLEISQ